MKGTGLFGWCLPHMGIDQHKVCPVTISDGAITCPCPCHTDFDAFAKQLSAPKRKKGKTK